MRPIGVPRPIPNHTCQLPVESDDAVVQIIHSGYFLLSRRRFRRFFIASEANPQSKTFYKSLTNIYEQQLRHLSTHYYMIHPFSCFTIMRENVMILVYLFQLILLLPLELIYVIDTPIYIMYPKLALDVISYMDVIIHFFAGRFDKTRQLVVMNPKVIMWHYIFGKRYINGLFLPDVLSSLPVTFIMYMTGRQNLFYGKAVFFFKIIRIPTLFEYINNYFIRHKFWSYSLKSIQVFILLVIGVFWCLGATIYFSKLTEKLQLMHSKGDDMVESLVDLCTNIVECVMLVGPDPLQFRVTWEKKILPICYILLGSFVNMVILAQILRIFKSRHVARSRHLQLLQEIEQYTVYKQISEDLSEKIMNYVNFKYHRKLLREAEIMSTLSEMLREELWLHKCHTLIERVEFFKDLPSAFLIKVVTRLKPEVYLANDVIFNSGDDATAIYFVYVGTISLYADDGKEIFRYGEGKHFGEVALINNMPQLFTAVARKDSELLRLKWNDVMELLKPFPALRARLAKREHKLSLKSSFTFRTSAIRESQAGSYAESQAESAI